MLRVFITHAETLCVVDEQGGPSRSSSPSQEVGPVGRPLGGTTTVVMIGLCTSMRIRIRWVLSARSGSRRRALHRISGVVSCTSQPNRLASPRRLARQKEERKQAALERSRARQAQADYFAAKAEANKASVAGNANRLENAGSDKPAAYPVEVRTCHSYVSGGLARK
jgi:hypothetical protein